MNTATPTIAALLDAIRSEPHNRLHRLVLADALEETGDRRFEESRNAVPSLDAVIQRLWPGAKTVWVGYSRLVEARSEVHSKHGKFLMTTSYLAGQINGDYFLVDSDIARAAEIERGLAVLKLFAKEKQ